MSKPIHQRQNESQWAVFQINAAVFLFGMAGLFAKYLQLPAVLITFGRVLFSSIALLDFCGIRRIPLRIPQRRHRWLLTGAGIVLAFHWWAFLQAIQLSTVAIGTITFSAFPLFITFLEPLISHEKLRLRNVAMAVLILLGVLITVPGFTLENHMTAGILIGLLSAFAYAGLTLMNRFLAGQYPGMVISFYEQAAAAIVLLPFALLARVVPTLPELGLLIFLGVITTALAHSLFISSLKHISGQLAGVISALEAVYGILLALLLLGEVPSAREVIGGCIIVGVAICGQLLREK